MPELAVIRDCSENEREDLTCREDRQVCRALERVGRVGLGDKDDDQDRPGDVDEIGQHFTGNRFLFFGHALDIASDESDDKTLDFHGLRIKPHRAEAGICGS